MAELLASFFPLFHCGEENCSVIDLHCAPNEKDIDYTTQLDLDGYIQGHVADNGQLR